MQHVNFRYFRLAALVVTTLLAFALRVQAGTESVLYTFTGGSDGSGPIGRLVFDGAGDAFGVTSGGGNLSCGNGVGCGTVFELKPGSGGWTHVVLYSFAGGSDGANPASGPVMDSKGNLYGTTYQGGKRCGCGIVYRLKPNANGTWTEKVIYRFTGGSDGLQPFGGIVLDKGGNIYGTTQLGGGLNAGTVFELKFAGGTWTEVILHTFGETNDGSNPQSGLVLDQKGNLYGTADVAGAYGDGVAFKMTPNSDGSWTESVLHNFTGGRDGAAPLGGVTLRNGNLFGTTHEGGEFNVGTVVKLIPTQGNWKTRMIRTFQGGNKGGRPSYAGLVFDKTGNAYSTTASGGYYQFGTVYKLSPQRHGQWHETVLYNFTGGSDGGSSCCGVVYKDGNLFGVSFGSGDGVVFEVTP